MKYAVLNILLGVTGTALSVAAGLWQDAHFLWGCWPAGNFFALGAAYALRCPGMFGKRQDGTLPWWSWLVFLPLHILTLLTWHSMRLFLKEPPFAAVINDRLYAGRRLLAGELPPGPLTVLDLTAEFSEPPGIVRRTDYRAFPILDAFTPSGAALPEYLLALPDHQPLYIHCAQGHGRTGMVAAAWLVLKGYAASPDAAVQMLRAVRPGIRLNTAQQDYLRALFSHIRPETEGNR